MFTFSIYYNEILLVQASTFAGCSPMCCVPAAHCSSGTAALSSPSQTLVGSAVERADRKRDLTRAGPGRCQRLSFGWGEERSGRRRRGGKEGVGSGYGELADIITKGKKERGRRGVRCFWSFTETNAAAQRATIRDVKCQTRSIASGTTSHWPLMFITCKEGDKKQGDSYTLLDSSSGAETLFLL